MSGLGYALGVPAIEQQYARSMGVDTAAALVALQTALGASLLNMWQPDAARVSLTGSNVSTMSDIAGSATMSLSSGSPIWNAAGGAGGRPYIDISTASTLMLADGVAVAAANRVGIYVVGACPGTTADRIIVACRQADGTGGSACSLVAQNAAGKFRGFMAFTGGNQDVSSTVNADSDWHLFALRPLSTAASLQRDGAESSPTFTGNDTVKAIESVHIGQNVGSAGGKFGMALLLDLASNASAKDQAIRSYVHAVFGLAV